MKKFCIICEKIVEEDQIVVTYGTTGFGKCRTCMQSVDASWAYKLSKNGKIIKPNARDLRFCT